MVGGPDFLQVGVGQFAVDAVDEGAEFASFDEEGLLTYAGVLKRVKGDPRLAKALQETRESVVDLAQSQLITALRDGAAWAVKFTLEIWGKSRGFSKQLEVVQPEQQGHVVIHIPDNGRMQSARARTLQRYAIWSCFPIRSTPSVIEALKRSSLESKTGMLSEGCCVCEAGVRFTFRGARRNSLMPV